MSGIRINNEPERQPSSVQSGRSSAPAADIRGGSAAGWGLIDFFHALALVVALVASVRGLLQHNRLYAMWALATGMWTLSSWLKARVISRLKAGQR